MRHLRAVVAAVAVCLASPAVGSDDDPFEIPNRAMHEFNVSLDRFMIRPLSTVYGTITPEIVVTGIENFASNLALPATVFNNMLQLNFRAATDNVTRFALNTTAGVYGIFDFADLVGMEEQTTDFGETLHVWGVPSGPYVVLPAFGPSNVRDTLGLVVDIVVNPLYTYTGQYERLLITAAQAASALGTRYRSADTVDELYYDSADSYGTVKVFYTQYRQYKLLGGIPEEDYFDPYSATFYNPFAYEEE